MKEDSTEQIRRFKSRLRKRLKLTQPLKKDRVLEISPLFDSLGEPEVNPEDATQEQESNVSG